MRNRRFKKIMLVLLKMNFKTDVLTLVFQSIKGSKFSILFWPIASGRSLHPIPLLFHVKWKCHLNVTTHNWQRIPNACIIWRFPYTGYLHSLKFCPTRFFLFFRSYFLSWSSYQGTSNILIYSISFL